MAEKIKSLAEILAESTKCTVAATEDKLVQALGAREQQLRKLGDCLCTQVRRLDSSGHAVGAPMLLLSEVATQGLPFGITWPRGLAGPTRKMSEKELENHRGKG